MLRYRADVKTLIFVGIYFALVVVGWTEVPLTLAAWPLVALVFILTCFFSFFGAVATHNGVHSPMFTSRAMNRAFQVVLTLTYGNPVSSYVPGHNLSHHKYTQSRRDVMRTTKTRHRWHLLNGLFFIFHVAGAILKGDQRYFSAMFKRNLACRAAPSR
jgi:fatty acid desaturase